ncbi:hypothetical protein SAMN05421820_103397 [Pedobacter steynii]|uniref:Outer membrane protein beta-barrel domain-containing protein n=1 Tax=Pedobacter steynii TaxID=430522 RepID=A0A1G9RY43_9SPHI|nr:hypothetical protein [Pedobacter steynii]NQX37612.1 hypothetical protein [Pedobacter steynii]SDM27947.1 hypothetical protein SAMN05421820_103397 [Pedobacter steynii]
MKKILLAIALFTAASMTVMAQNKNNKSFSDSTSNKMISKFKISIGLDEGIPVGHISKYSSFVMGASVQGEYLPLKELGITLSANYVYYLGKDGEDGLSMLPVMGGVNFYITPKVFLSGQVGAAWYINKGSEKDTYFTYAQGIGFMASKRISLLAKYEGINVGTSRTYSFAGLRVAYNFYK